MDENKELVLLSSTSFLIPDGQLQKNTHAILMGFIIYLVVNFIQAMTSLLH